MHLCMCTFKKLKISQLIAFMKSIDIEFSLHLRLFFHSIQIGKYFLYYIMTDKVQPHLHLLKHPGTFNKS